MRKFLMIFVLFLPLAGCTDSYRAKLFAYGGTRKITIYSGGNAIKIYKSTGKVTNEESSDGFYFMDAATGRLVRVAGTVIVERE